MKEEPTPRQVKKKNKSQERERERYSNKPIIKGGHTPGGAAPPPWLSMSTLPEPDLPQEEDLVLEPDLLVEADLPRDAADPEIEADLDLDRNPLCR